MLIKSFSGLLTVEEFDNIYNEEITKRYENDKHKCKRLSSKIKNIRIRKDGAEKLFKLVIKNDFLYV